MSRSSRGPSSIGNLTSSIGALKLITAWKECAGPALDAQVTFLGIHIKDGKKILDLEVKDPMWRQELEYQKASILKFYRQKLGSYHVPESELPVGVDLLANGQFLMPRKSLPPHQSRKK